jgi:hypothetical protein
MKYQHIKYIYLEEKIYENSNLGKNYCYFNHSMFFAGTVQIGLSTSVQKTKPVSQITGTQTSFDPFVEGWLYQKQITIDHTKVASDLTNFPILISITDSDLQAKAQSNGNDILFMDKTGVAQQLNHEIEHYDETTGEITAWVNIPVLSHTIDTIFYMYYGNPTCPSQQNPEKTWDSSYLAVWHLNDATPSTISDSTSHEYIGIKTAANEPVQSNCKIGYGQNIDGLNDRISVSAFNIWDTMTVTFWFNTTATIDIPFSSNFYHVVDSNGFLLGINTIDGYVYFRTYNGDLRSCNLTADDKKRNDGDWYFCAATFSGGVGKLYLDANLKATSDSGKVLKNSTRPFYMGYSESVNYGASYLDEFKISFALKSTDWITTEFNNQNNPSGFLSIGPEKTSLKITIIFGRFANISSNGNFITITAVHLRCIQFSPFAFIPLQSGEHVLISKQYHGLLTSNRALLVCQAHLP